LHAQGVGATLMHMGSQPIMHSMPIFVDE